MFEPVTDQERREAEQLWKRDYPFYRWPPSSPVSFMTYIQKAREVLKRVKTVV